MNWSSFASGFLVGAFSVPVFIGVAIKIMAVAYGRRMEKFVRENVVEAQRQAKAAEAAERKANEREPQIIVFGATTSSKAERTH